MTDRKVIQSSIPSTRLGRFARLGVAAGELALGGIAEGVRNLGRAEKEPFVEAFLNAGNARKLARRLARMRGAAMKMGQMMSLDSTDYLPREFAEALAVLRDSAHTMPDGQLRRVLGREYGKGWESRFEHFDYQPIAAASIGQVHRVRTRDGRDVALKIQYPGVAKSINSDVDNMAALLRLSRLLPIEIDLSKFTDEIKRQLQREADYALEQDNIAWYRKLVRDDSRFIVPAVHADLSTKRILAMDYLEGIPVESLEQSGINQRQRNEIGSRLQALVFRELFEFRTMQSDPNFANYLYQPDTGRIVLLDFGATVSFEKVFSDHYAGIAGALMADDKGASRHYAEKLGYLRSNSSEEYAARIMEIVSLIFEPIRKRGIYDFGRSDLFARAKSLGIAMFMDGIGSAEQYAVPPPEASFLHRKLVGCYMLSSRLKARFNVQDLIRPYLSDSLPV
jgi:predicted unusual protein kinase regulating ubiquinone biosynthesis (AarF/ABC1/UbiB family)